MKFVVVTVLAFLLTTPVFGFQVLSHLEVDSHSKVTADKIVLQANSALTAELKKIELCDAPKIGENRILSSQVIASILRKALARSGSRINRIKLPSQVVIENRNKVYSKMNIEKELVKRWSSICRDCQFIMNSISLPLLPVKRNVSHWRLDAVRSIPKGTFTQKVSIAIEGAPETIFWVTGQVEVRREVPVINKAKSFGSVLEKSDIEWQFRDVTFANDGIPSQKDLEGKSLKRGLRANEIIWFGALKKSKIFRRGDSVKLVSGLGPWQVTVNGIAQQDGYVGESSRVKNIKSNKVISGVVGKSGEVIVR